MAFPIYERKNSDNSHPLLFRLIAPIGQTESTMLLAVTAENDCNTGSREFKLFS
jgi:hypothetical protein